MNYVNLKEYIEILESGKRPKGGATDEGVPSLGGEHINSFGGFNLEKNKLRYVPTEYFNKLQKGIVQGNDILIVKDGATTGKVGYVDENFTLKECCINEHLFLLRTRSELNSKYLFYFLYSELGQYQVLKDFRGATVGGISRKFIEMPIYLPSYSEQLRIVETLDNIKALIEKRKSQIEELDLLVKSKFIEMFGDPVKNQKKLAKVKLSELGEWKTGGTPLRSKSEYYNGNIPWLSSGELNNKYCFKSNEMITESAIIESAAKIIEVGSLLLGMYDTAALKSTINMIECSCNQAIAYSKLNENLVNTVYVYYCIQIGKEFYKSKQRGVRQKNLNLSMVKGLEILMPPLEFQNQFANFVKQVDKLKFEMEKSLKDLEDNFNSLMQKAFKGELFN